MKEMTLPFHEVPVGKSEGATAIESGPSSPSPFLPQGLAVSLPRGSDVLSCLMCVCCRRWQFESMTCL